MPARTASAVWKGNLKGGSGRMRLGSGAFEGAYSFATRFGEEPGTNPEELVGAAHAGCFSMALAAGIERAGFVPVSVATEARVHLLKDEGGFAIRRIELRCEAEVQGIDGAAFAELAEEAKRTCPISRSLGGVQIDLDARLV